VVDVDVTAFSIALEEALSNARKYREPGTQIVCRAKVELRVEDGSTTLRAEVENTNKVGTAILSDEEGESCFLRGSKASAALASSDGVGLDSVRVVVGAARGRAWLVGSSHQPVPGSAVQVTGTSDRTVFGVELPVVVGVPKATPTSDHGAEAGAAGLAGASSSLPEQPVVQELPTAASTRVPAAAAQTGQEDATSPDALVCAALDDDGFARTLHQALFSHFLRADQQRSCVLGADAEEQLSFIDVALGRKHASLKEAVPSLPPADIVLLDQNIDLGEHSHLLGSDVAEQLCMAGYRGVTCIITGSSVEQIQQLSTCPGVDLVVPKGTGLATLADRLRALHKEKRRQAVTYDDL